MMCIMIQLENRGDPPTKRIRKTTKDLQKKLCTSANEGEIEKSLLETFCRELAIRL